MSRPAQGDERPLYPWEAREVQAAAREAGEIGGRAGDEDLDPAQRPLAEAGEGVAEGFELAEDELVLAAEHGDSRANPSFNVFAAEEATAAEGGEADHEESSETTDGDR